MPLASSETLATPRLPGFQTEVLSIVRNSLNNILLNNVKVLLILLALLLEEILLIIFLLPLLVLLLLVLLLPGVGEAWGMGTIVWTR